MALFLEITDGEMKGARTLLLGGLVIGRKDSGLTIRDSKLSSKHARVEERSDGTFWLIDLKSANGIKTEKGRVLALKLESGAAFTLGRTPFAVISTEDAVAHSDMPEEAVAPTVTRTSWDSIRELAERGRVDSRVVKSTLVPIVPSLRLQFTRGVQTGTVWTIGYGPRVIGAASIDLHLEDPTAADVCFRLEPHADGVVLKNKEGTRVNGHPVETAELRHGDTIEIMNTQLLVVFDES